ncbi:MAG: hypothetical protein AAGC58_12625 [Asticcacaulis sp.]
MSEAVRDKLRKLAELAARGVGGEAENAEAIFHKLCRKHGFSPSDFEDGTDPAETVWFSFKSQPEKALLQQLSAMVTDSRDVPTWSRRAKPKTIGFDLTKAHAAEVRFLFAIYRAAWAKEVDRLYLAFVHKHHIFAPTPTESAGSSMSEAERERLFAMVGSLETVSVNKAIADGRNK